MLGWLVALLAARWLIPTEGSAEGLTLWLVQLVLLTAVARTIWNWRFRERPLAFDAVDIALALLIAPQVVSALAVVLGVGNARAAINVAWEWVGSGVLIWLLRNELRRVPAVRSLCLGLSLSAAVLSGYGLWQHFVWYDEISREYQRLTTEYDRLSQSASDGRRLPVVRAEMARQGIPLEPAARKLLEQRLHASREPFGLFALANTFAGLLAVMLLIVLGIGLDSRSRLDRCLAVGMALVIGFCLVLTKSRTAWVGLLAGGGWWTLRAIALRWRRDATATQKGPRVLLWLAVGVVVLGLATIVAGLSGGLDKAVISEAPKSLRYRWEYWQGTWQSIREQFWLGTGPGNFRDHYLKHKLPESSEEIADPHNFVFDIWANAGTLGLLGLIGCLGVLLRVGLRSPGSPRIPAEREDAERPPREWRSPAAWGVVLAFPLTAVGLELIGQGSDERLWWLGGIWGLLWLTVAVIESRGTPVMDAGRPRCDWLRMAFEAAALGLCVHLLGAGGIAMPAITQLFWLVWSLRFGSFESWVSDDAEKRPSNSAAVGVQAGRLASSVQALLAAGMCLLCAWSATLPELVCRTSLQLGDDAWGRGQSSAIQHYLDASRADAQAIEPLERLAEVAFQRWQASRDNTAFEEAVQRWQTICHILPFASRPYRRLGQIWRVRAEWSGSATDATPAAESFAAAVERYPHHAELLAEWATACELAGRHDEARQAASRAVRQDDINRSAGHSDKYLAESLRQRMDRLAATASEPN
jgi:hypothetical protein